MPKKRITKVITKTGDDGSTSWDGKTRIPKDDPRVEVLGTIDELNSYLGLVLAADGISHEIAQILSEIQHQLFDLGAELCTPPNKIITEAYVNQCESIAKKLNANLPALQEFILPGGNLPTAYCHLARAVCRRAERRLVTLNHVAKVNPQSLIYLNRLSDLLFIIARIITKESGSSEILYNPGRSSHNSV